MSTPGPTNAAVTVPSGGGTSRHGAGIVLCLLAVFIFACQDAITKYLTRDYAIPQIVMVRQWVFLAFALAYGYWRVGDLSVFLSRRPWLQILRSALWVGEMMMFALAVRYLPLADTHALFAIFPILTTLLAVPVLGERFGWRRGAAVATGFAGTLLILRPGLGVFDPAALIALTAAGMFSLYNLQTRLVSHSDRFETSVFFMAATGFVIATAWGVPTWRPPTGQGLSLMLVLSVTGILGHMLLVKALEYAPASLLQPFNYSMIVWAIAIGWIVFGDLPDHWTLIGAAIVAGSGLYVVARERQVNRRVNVITEGS